MPTRKAQATWQGKLKDGKGSMDTGSGGCRGDYSAGSRFADDQGTNPEELLGAAHAGCFSMALSHVMDESGIEAKKIDTSAAVKIEQADGGYRISAIDLHTQVAAEDLDESQLKKFAEDARDNCPVSKVLGDVNISVDAKLVS